MKSKSLIVLLPWRPENGTVLSREGSIHARPHWKAASIKVAGPVQMIGGLVRVTSGDKKASRGGKGLFDLLVCIVVHH